MISKTSECTRGDQKVMYDISFIRNFLFNMQEMCTQFTWIGLCPVNISETVHRDISIITQQYLHQLVYPSILRKEKKTAPKTPLRTY